MIFLFGTAFLCGFFNPLFRRVILLENTNKPARRIFDGQFCGLVSIYFWH
jgi:hypothetical protein